MDFAAMPGWLFVSPVLYPALSGGGSFLTSADGKLLMSSPELWFVVPEDYLGNPAEEGEKILRFLNNLRHGSGQAELPISIMVAIRSEITDLPAPTFPTASATACMTLMRKYLMDTAVKVETLQAALAVSDAATTPIFYTVLFEAMVAAINLDHRKAILYTAIALEGMANTKLDEAYTAARQQPFPSHLRLRTISLGGGGTEVQDQVYAKMLNAKEDFSQLLHLRPLYLIERSLKFDDEPLFGRAVSLYSTRNKLAHSGEVPSDSQELLPLTPDGAMSALDTAISVFRWFGEGSMLSVPRIVPFQVPRLECSSDTPGFIDTHV